jgi:RimJ/RimL family protein N-acetyltransferase
MQIYKLEKIETARLIIRPVKLGDELEISQAIQRSLKSLQRWMPWAKDPSFATTADFVKRADEGWSQGKSNDFPMVAIHKLNGKIISATGFNEESRPDSGCYEIGYWIDEPYQGQGFVTEFVNALTRFALVALKAQSVQICTQAENLKSIAVAKRCGFRVEKVLKGHRADCESGLPADSILFVCNNVLDLPALEVSWVYKS